MKGSFIALTFALFTNTFAVAQQEVLFQDETPLAITLRGDLKDVFNDRGEESPYHNASVSYESNGAIVTVPIRIKTRGHFRKAAGNCQYPPLQLNFSSKTKASTLFSDQDKMKLVTPCRGDKYVVREYLAYKVSNVVSQKSFRARLVKVVYEDSVKGKSSDPLFGILLEEEEQMAKRNNAETIDRQVRPEQTKKEDFLRMAVFEYLIGNTDWSVQYLQNVKLISDPSGSPVTVPYDFDHAGIVAAPYAKPAPELQMSSTRERRYRGYCIKDIAEFKDTFDYFNSIKDDIYNVFKESTLLDEGYVKYTVKFLDEFYTTINDPKAAKEAFGYPCDPEGTGNVVIKGLRN